MQQPSKAQQRSLDEFREHDKYNDGFGRFYNGRYRRTIEALVEKGLVVIGAEDHDSDHYSPVRGNRPRRYNRQQIEVRSIELWRKFQS